MISFVGGFFSCLLWGLGAVVLYGVILWLLRAFFDLRYSIASAIIAAVCVIGVFWESVQIAGGLHVKSYVSDISDYVDSFATVTDGNNISLGDVMKRLPPELNVVEDIADICDVNLTGSAQAFIESVEDELSSYLWARVAWLVGIVLVGSVAFILLCERGIGYDVSSVDTTDLDIY